MEMYADPDGRGGVLEPEGTVEIRFRSKDLVRTMDRCDPQRVKLVAELKETADPEVKKSVEKKLKEGESHLMGMYHQVALHFADLHDKPHRMLEKGVICDIIPWAKSRHSLYWRLRCDYSLVLSFVFSLILSPLSLSLSFFSFSHSFQC